MVKKEKNKDLNMTQEEKVNTYVEKLLTKHKEKALIRAIQSFSFYKANNCFEEVVNNLIQKKGKEVLLATTDDGSSSLLWAVRIQDASLVRKVIEEAPELLNQKNKEGYTPHLLASRFYDVNVLRELHNAGAKTDDKTVDGLTAINLAFFDANRKENSR